MNVQKVKKSNGTNGHAAHAPAATLADQEQAEIRALTQNLAEAKAQLANLQCQIMIAEEQRAKLAASVIRADESLVVRVKSLAASKGLPPDGWNFDISTMSFAPKG